MLRYVATALVAATLLAIALRSSGSGPAARTLAVPAGAPPAVESREVAGGRELRVLAVVRERKLSRSRALSAGLGVRERPGKCV